MRISIAPLSRSLISALLSLYLVLCYGTYQCTITCDDVQRIILFS